MRNPFIFSTRTVEWAFMSLAFPLPLKARGTTASLELAPSPRHQAIGFLYMYNCTLSKNMSKRYDVQRKNDNLKGVVDLKEAKLTSPVIFSLSFLNNGSRTSCGEA
ncbi:hypothetical protein Y032_0013g2061 [Ancylostoma ceylanicum]|uniref:Uncharacterized protein n=1 Tax=Ancylostoma ceylanicum TaxID=53326 RepID=A0A016VD93_9BILA|nr:hypothetical protein Y032_0013g2061 [Ancylostoma ceylanicum]